MAEPQQTTPAADRPQVPNPAAAPVVADPSKRPFEAAAKIVRAVQLSSVRFRAISARALEPADADLQPEHVSGSTRFSKPTVDATESGFSTRTTLIFNVGGAPSAEDASPKAYALLQASLEATYTFKPDAPQFAEDDLRDFALCYCPFHVWGYWREFVQSSLARLELPQLTLPLFLIHQAPQLVQERPEQ